MERIVVGVDGSAASAAALRFAIQIATGGGAEILAVNAYEHPYSEVVPNDHERQLADALAMLEDVWLRPVSDTGVVVHPRVHEGDPREIVDIANSEGADLLVLGRTGSGTGPGFLHLGSVVEHAAHHSRAALAVMPPHLSSPMARIVIGVDGSPESTAAVTWCVDHAAALGADVLGVFVEEPVTGYTQSSRSVDRPGDVEREIATWTSGLSEAGVLVTPIAKRDVHPADGLIGVAAAHGAELLVVGTRGAGRFSGVRIGGVAMKVLHQASLPVVLVPPEAALAK